MNIYSVKNEKLGFFNAPMYFETSNGAMNHMQNILMSDADRALQGLKGDLALYYLGTVDFVSGKIDVPQEPIKIADLLDLFNSIPEDRVPRTEKQLLKLIEDLGVRIKKLEEKEEKKVISDVSRTKKHFLRKRGDLHDGSELC